MANLHLVLAHDVDFGRVSLQQSAEAWFARRLPLEEFSNCLLPDSAIMYLLLEEAAIFFFSLANCRLMAVWFSFSILLSSRDDRFLHMRMIISSSRLLSPCMSLWV